ncbi:hypothetical protein ACFE04_028425 [Oxalis oulophora]
MTTDTPPCLYLVSAFKAMEPPDSLISLARLCGDGFIITESVQRFIWDHCINNNTDDDDARAVHVKKFLKKLILEVESTNGRVLDELYQQYAHFMATSMDDNLVRGNARVIKYISFLYPDDSVKHPSCPSSRKLMVPLQCSLNMLEGDTGCSIWPSSLFLSEFILSFPDLFSGKSCFEVGSGVGLVGICLAHVKAAKVILSDGDLSTLANMKINLELNNLNPEIDVTQRSVEDSTLVKCICLPWEVASKSDLGDFMRDIILGADVVYDPLCLPHLVRVLAILLNKPTKKDDILQHPLNSQPIDSESDGIDQDNIHPIHSSNSSSNVNGKTVNHSNPGGISKESKPVAYIACIIRNIETFNYFLQLAKQSNLSITDMTETVKPFYMLPYMQSYDRSSKHAYKLTEFMDEVARAFESMSNITVCARFRPLSSKERNTYGDSVCIRSVDSESFVFTDDKEEDFWFSFDRVFYEESAQSDVYNFLALPIARDAVNGINGTIITYGQTGAGKTYSMEGPDILECDEQKKGLLPRVVDGLFECIKFSDESTKYTIKLSMVEIYMEKVRCVSLKIQSTGNVDSLCRQFLYQDLFDLSKDNIQIKESKVQGILLSGVTEVFVKSSAEALQSLSRGIANRAVGETRSNLLKSFTLAEMNMASSRSHCVYVFMVHQELTKDKRTNTGKLVLVDLAGSEKVEKTGAEGKILEEAKTINKSLSALGNVINALTCGSAGRATHIPYRDSKLTRILQDALGGNSRTALLCCCSPSTFNASEILSTLRFGASLYSSLVDFYGRAKHIKASPCVSSSEGKTNRMHGGAPHATKDESRERILCKLRERLNEEDVELLEELFTMEGLLVESYSAEDLESALEDITSRTISSLQEYVTKLEHTNKKIRLENENLKAKLAAVKVYKDSVREEVEKTCVLHQVSEIYQFFISWIRSHSPLKMPNFTQMPVCETKKVITFQIQILNSPLKKIIINEIFEQEYSHILSLLSSSLIKNMNGWSATKSTGFGLGGRIDYRSLPSHNKLQLQLQFLLRQLQ